MDIYVGNGKGEIMGFKRICDDTCDNCVYICEGDFICSELNELVIVDWVPVYGACVKRKKKDLFNQKKGKKIFKIKKGRNKD